MVETFTLRFNFESLYKIYLNRSEKTVYVREIEGDKLVVKPKRYLNVFLGKDGSVVNFLLVQLDENKYMYLYGRKKRTFSLARVNDEIKSIVSKFGNNMYPYPVFLGEKYKYIITEDFKVMKISNEDSPGRNVNALYDEFWLPGRLEMQLRVGRKPAREVARIREEIQVAKQRARLFTGL